VRKMTEASATALAFRMSLEIVPVDCTVDGQVTRLLQLSALFLQFRICIELCSSVAVSCSIEVQIEQLSRAI
jgi:hypothetical protein